MEFISLEEQRKENLNKLTLKRERLDFEEPKVWTERIKELRVKYALTYEDVAKLVGLSQSAYYKRECGILQFNIPELYKIMELYGIRDLRYFIKVKEAD
jgi:DNA-binding XRE family transcriptional regulator